MYSSEASAVPSLKASFVAESMYVVAWKASGEEMMRYLSTTLMKEGRSGLSFGKDKR